MNWAVQLWPCFLSRSSPPLLQVLLLFFPLALQTRYYPQEKHWAPTGVNPPSLALFFIADALTKWGQWQKIPTSLKHSDVQTHRVMRRWKSGSNLNSTKRRISPWKARILRVQLLPGRFGRHMRRPDRSREVCTASTLILNQEGCFFAFSILFFSPPLLKLCKCLRCVVLLKTLSFACGLIAVLSAFTVNAHHSPQHKKSP